MKNLLFAGLIQPVMAYFRPHPGTEHRPIFNWAHFLVGNLAIAFAHAAIATSMFVPAAAMARDVGLIIVLSNVFICELLRAVLIAYKWKHEHEEHKHPTNPNENESDQKIRSLCLFLKLSVNVVATGALIYLIAARHEE